MSLHPRQHSLLSIFFIITIWVSVNWYLTEVLICKTPDDYWCWVSFHVLSLLHICVFFGEVSIHILCQLFTGSCFYCRVLRVLYSESWTLTRYMIFRCFLQFYGLAFHFVNSVLWSTVFILTKFHLAIFPFVAYTFDIISKKSLPNLRSQTFTPMFSFTSVLVLALIFRSLTHLKTFIQNVFYCGKY